jgi:endonuclease YncB( thermonuclease family)
MRSGAGLLLWALCLGLAGGATADDGSPTVTGRVTRVTDGDTIAVALDSGPIIVRLGSIDAPERRQPWGAEARMALLRRIEGRDVLLEVTSQDRYDRLVATVYVEDDGGETDLNAWMVENGHAWVFRRFARDEQLCEREDAARKEGLGLWKRSGPKPAAPWEWRAAGSDRTAPFTDFGDETAERCIESMREAQARSAARRARGSNRAGDSGGSTMTAEPVVAEMACQKEAARQGLRLMRQRPAQAIGGGFRVEMDVRTGDGGLEQRECRFWTNTGRAQLGL